jgi:hypothetical protein
MDERLDLREQVEHLLIDASRLRIVVAHGRLGNSHGASHVNLFHLVRSEKFPGEPRSDRGQQLGDHEFLGLEHQRTWPV